jgi:DNA-binding MarR family transcriptional regulator
MQGNPKLSRRLRDGIDRIASVQRAALWSETDATGLTPTQGRILAFLSGRGPSRVTAIAQALGVTQPSATGSIKALEGKGLVERQSDVSDGRAANLRLTRAGRTAHQAANADESSADAALAALTVQEQETLLVLLTKVIRGLQLKGAIVPQRTCVSCRYFRPHTHANSKAPHHCNFVDAPIGSGDLRLDCGEHETAEPALQAVTWKAFNGAADLRATGKS